MGWVWQDDGEDRSSSSFGRGFGGINGPPNPNSNPNNSDNDRCSTRRIVRSECRTEEVEPGKFIRKCEKKEEILKSCFGKPVEVLKSSSEYIEDDVTNEMARGEKSFPSISAEVEPFKFPGLRSDMEAIEKNLFGSLGNFFEAAEEMKNGFFHVFGTPPGMYERKSPPPQPFRQGIPIEGPPEESPINNDDDSKKRDEWFSIDFGGKVRDV